LTKNQLTAILGGTFVLAVAFIGYVKWTEVTAEVPEAAVVQVPVRPNDGGTRAVSTWTFALDSESVSSLNQFEVRNQTSGEVVHTSEIKDGVVSVEVATNPGDVLTVQCWLADSSDWCASNQHNGHIVSAAGSGGVYKVDRKAGDLSYVSDGLGQRYGCTAK
jgi:hypothetical protein